VTVGNGRPSQDGSTFRNENGDERSAVDRQGVRRAVSDAQSIRSREHPPTHPGLSTAVDRVGHRDRL